MLPPLQCPAMFRALLVTLPLLAGLAQAAPNTLEQRPLSLETAQGTLHGTLLQPRSDEPLAVALLIAGSGPTDRDGNNPADGHNDSLKKLAQNLARHGIASLRYDKRGVAASRAATPNERDLSVDAYVTDAVAWGRLLKRDKVDFMTGIVFSNVMLAVGTPTFQSKTFYISANAGPSSLAGEQCKANYFAASYQNDVPHEMAGVAANELGYKKMVILAPNYQAGKDALSGFKRFYKGTVIDEVYTQVNQPDYSAEIAQLHKRLGNTMIYVTHDQIEAMTLSTP